MDDGDRFAQSLGLAGEVTSHLGRVQVLHGLQPGELVVVRGALLLDGAAEKLM